MRIERFEVHPVAIPLAHPYRDATRVETHSRDVLVRLVAEGVEGWGAGTPRRFPTGETQVGTAHVLQEVLASVVVGADPNDTPGVQRAMEAAIPGNFAAKVAVDIALHDLVGRILDRPIHELLGGMRRDAMPTLDILPLELPGRMAESARDLRDRMGTRAFKVKIDADIPTGVERVAAVREAVPDAMLVVDANGVWNVAQALDACRRLEPYRVRVVEQPVPGPDLDGLAEVSRQSTIPIGADESAQPQFVDRLVAMKAARVVNIKLTREGGYRRSLEVATAAGSAGLEVVCGSVIQTGLVDAACAHLFAALPSVAYNESGKGPSWHPHDVVHGLRVEDGLFHVPTGPGLGVSVDEEAVRAFRPMD